MKKGMMTTPLVILTAVIFCSVPALAKIADQNLLTASGGQNSQKTVYSIEVPADSPGPIYLRIFDADAAGEHDIPVEGTTAVYRLYGKGTAPFGGSDPLPQTSPLFSLSLGEDRHYDNLWRTVHSLNAPDGEQTGDRVLFQFTVDTSGGGTHKYQIFLSSDEKKNAAVDGLRFYTRALTLQLPVDPGRVTQIRFTIPQDASALSIFSSADAGDLGTKIYFDSRHRSKVSLPGSADKLDKKIRRADLRLLEAEKGGDGAIILAGLKINSIQLWISDDQGRPIALELPTLTAPENRLPVPRIQSTLLSDCFKVVLDASGTRDPDNHEISAEWVFEDGTTVPGTRIIHDFQVPGSYPVTLVVRDNSGFAADTSRLTEIIHVPKRPKAVIQAPDRGIPGTPVLLDAESSDPGSGQIIRYEWNLGDGNHGTGSKITHTYALAGRYPVSLAVENNGVSPCNLDRIRHEIWINAPPSAHIKLKPIAAVNEAVMLDAGGSLDTDGQIMACEWDFGDGRQGQGPQISHQWEKPGKYLVTVKVTDDAGVGNSAALTRSDIVINAPPVPAINAPAAAAAQEEIVLDAGKSYDPDGRIITYAWTLGDGSVKTGKTIRHAYANPGVYEATVSVSDDSGVSNDTVPAHVSIRVNHPPVPQAGGNRVVNSSEVIFDASASTDADDEIIEYLWDFGDGQSAWGVQTSHVYALPGKYRVRLTVTDASGTRSGVQSDEAEIFVNHPPAADAGGIRRIAEGEAVLFEGIFSQDPDGRIMTFEWEIDGAIFKGEKVSHVFDRHGIYQAGLKVTDDRGAEDMDYAEIRVNHPPVPHIAPIPRAAAGDMLVFDGTLSEDPDGQITRAVWNFSDGTPPEEGLMVRREFKNPGRYLVTLTVEDDSRVSNSSASVRQTIEVNYPPLADAGQDVHTCGQRVRFDGSLCADPDADPLTWTWDFGDGTTSGGMIAEHGYGGPGIYPVVMTVDDGQGLGNSLSRDALTVYVNAPPQAAIQANRETICAGESVLLDAGRSRDPEGGPLKFLWDFGDGRQSEEVHPAPGFDRGGDYKIRLTALDNSGLPCAQGQAEMILHVIDAPVARAGEDQQVCAGTTVQFDGSASTGGGRPIKSFEWDFGDGQKGVGIQPAYLYKQAGTYQVRLKITVEGQGECKNISEAQIQVVVTEAPAAVFDAPSQACAGEPVRFDGSGSAASAGNGVDYSWDFGDGTTGTGPAPVHEYREPGGYGVRLTIKTDKNQDCGTGDVLKPIRINAPPAPMIRVSSPGETPQETASYSSLVNTVLHFSAEDSTDSDGYIRQYVWKFGDDQTAEGPFVSHQYRGPGKYTVSLMVLDNSETSCSQQEKQMEVVINPPPVPVITGPDAGCAGHPLEYKVSGDYQDTAWTFNDGHKDSGSRIERTFDRPGVYQVQAESGGFRSPAWQTVIRAIPEIKLPEKITGFPGDRVKIIPLYKKSDPLVFEWDMGDGAALKTETADHAYASPGSYTARLRVAGKDGPECLTTEYPIPVFVLEPPAADIQISPDTGFTGGARDEIIFKAALTSGKGKWNYSWEFGDGNRAQGRMVTHRYAKPGEFTVSLTLSDALGVTEQRYVFTRKIHVHQRK
jgi:PKD repeat protein